MEVKTRYGKFSVFTDSDLISRSLLLYGEWAQPEIDILGQFISRGDAVVDAGAYIGTHTVAFSLMVGSQGSVHSFEPNGHARELLVKNVLVNSPNNVTVHECALGEARARATLETVGDQNLGATRVRSLRKTAKRGVAIETLDSFRLKKVEFVKADVEGWEMSLVRGATATIGSFRPTIFLECNSLQAILELPAWLRQNEYISYGLLVGAFNPRNFNDSKENIFGPSKECGLLLIPRERSASLSMTIQRLNLPLVATIDDAALLLLHKPQYAYEILEKSISASVIGINYPSPALGAAAGQFEVEVRSLNAKVLDLRGEMETLSESLGRDYAAKMADQEAKTDRKIQAMTVQVVSLTQTGQSLQQEIQLQKASFYKKAHETNQAHVALEKELQEELLLTQREIQTVEEDWAAKTANQKADAGLKADAMTQRVDSLTQTIQSLQQESLLQRASLHKEVHAASQAHAALERELREDLSSKQAEIEALNRDWAAKMANQQAESERKAQPLVMQVDSLTQENQSLQQAMLLQSASLHKEAHVASQTHAGFERELREGLSSKQAEIEVLNRDWAAKMANQQPEAERKRQSLITQVDSLTQTMQSAEQEQRRHEAAYSEKALEAGKVRAALEEDLRDNLQSVQREIESQQKTWAAKMADQQAESEQKLEVVAGQVTSLTQSLLLAEQEQRRQEAAYSVKTLEVGKVRAALEEDLRDKLQSVQREIESQQKTWAAKMADQHAESEQKLEVIASQVNALTKSRLVAEEEQHRQKTVYSERVIEANRIHSEVEMDLQERLLIARTDMETLELAKSSLEAEKARVEASFTWRASERARRIASGLFGTFVLNKNTNPDTTGSLLKEPKEQILSVSFAENGSKHADDGAAIDDAHDREMQEIFQSGLFDAEYYLSAYADVASANADPLSHFMNYGWKEGRNPSEGFETSFYLDTYPDVKESNVNPLTHYVRFGKSEERKKASIEMLSDISLYFDLIDGQKHVPIIAGSLAIDIVIPIYNGFDYLGPLFRSIFSHTSAPYRLIVVEDASPDIRVKEFLRELMRTNTETDILLIENVENLGFVRSVNKAVAEVRNHFVLLNSDTEVPPNWIERLMFPILEMDNVASTTPFTNSGTICSFPLYLKDNPLFEELDAKIIDGYFQFVKFGSNYLPIPTGIGFCMGVNKRVVDEIGMFDEIFGRGYCEENDWSARAEKRGYRNLQVPNLFVYHKHGGSFPSEERKRLIEQNYSILLEKHPSYDTNVQKFIRSDSLKDLRQFLIMLLSANEVGAALIFDNELGGGAHQFRKEWISQRLNNGEVVFLISYKSNKEKVATLEFYFKTYNFSFSIRQPQDLVKLFRSLKVKEIVVNSFVSFPNVEEWIEVTARIRGSTGACRLIVLAHDYFPVCPSYTLINDSNAYCGVPSDLKVCRGCLTSNMGDFRRFEAHSDILTWRTQWDTFLQGCDEIVCFGNSSADILRRTYPSIEMEKIVVRPHDISGRLRQIYFGSWKSTVKNIGVLGAINLAKGSNVLRDLVEYIDSRRLPVKVILFGEIDIEIRSASFEVTGRYAIDCLEPVILEKNIDLFLLPSIWPETFSFTADEIMQMGFPLVAFNIGAPAERVRGYALGKVIEQRDLYTVLFGDGVSAEAA